MYVIKFKSESGDDYIIGPFDHVPTHDEAMAVFEKHSGEAEYVKEMVADGMWGDKSPFEAHKLPETPGLIDFQMGGAIPCKRQVA